MDKIPCFCCKKELELETMDIDPLTITGLHGGLWFDATGNYGSTIFDPLPHHDESHLRIAICDECINAKAQEVKHIYNVKRTIKSQVKPWSPKDET